MAEEFGTVETEDFDYSDLEPYEEVAEVEEKKVDDDNVKQTKLVRKIAEKQAQMEAQLAREKMLSDFYAKASDEAKEFADVFVAGVSDPAKVKKMLELAEAKAAKIAGTATTEQTETVDEADVEAAFAAPLAAAPPEVRDVGKETAEKTRKGDPSAAWLEFLAAPASGPPNVT